MRPKLINALLFTIITFSQLASAEPFSIPTAGGANSPATLVVHRYSPIGSGPHPAVVMLHGCGGAYDREGRVSARHRMWGDYLASEGYVALLVDSFSTREIQEICTIRLSERPLKEIDRVGDAYAALAWLRQQHDILPNRIGLLGWSHGAGVVLKAIDQQAGEGFNAAVAFYPGCSSRSSSAKQFHPYAPLLLLIGEADDWTPAEPCRKLTEAVAERGEPMAIVLYPDTYHDFDNPGLKTLRVRKEVPNGVHPGKGVTVAPNAQAREDAKRRVTDFLHHP